MSFIAQDFDSLNVIAILDGRTQATIRNHFLRYPRKVRNRVKVITMDMFSPYYQLAKQLFPNAKIVLDRFHIVQHLSRSMNWKVNEKLDTELREFKNYIFQSLLETCNQELNASFLYCNRSQCI